MTSNSKSKTTAPNKPNVGEGPLLVRGSPETKILSRDDPRCGVIPNACGALIRLNSHMERNLAKKSLLREKQKSLKDFGCDTGLSGDILFHVFVRNSKVITERTESDHSNQ